MRELARRSGKSHGTISNTLSGKTRPQPDTLRGVARALGVPAEVLFRLAGDLALPDEEYERELKAVIYELNRKGRAEGLRYLYYLLDEQGRGREGD